MLVEHQQHEATHLHREVEGSLLRVVTDIEAEFMLVIGAGKAHEAVSTSGLTGAWTHYAQIQKHASSWPAYSIPYGPL